MLKPFELWDRTLAAFGLLRLVSRRRSKARDYPYRRLQFEQLERRQLLTADVNVWVEAGATVSEDQTAQQFVVHRDDTDGSLTVYYSTSGSATAGNDYNGPTGSVQFANGESSKPVPVTLNDDSLHEPTETVVLTITPDATYEISPDGSASTLAVNDNDPLTLGISGPASVDESHGTVIFTVALSILSEAEITVDYEMQSGSATLFNDFQGGVSDPSGRLTFAPGEAIKHIDVEIINDDIDENANETFSLVLSNPQGGATLDPSATQVTTTIIDDDDTTISVSDLVAYESQSYAWFEISLSHANTEEVSVKYVTEDGDAKAGDGDYAETAVPTLVTFEPGKKSKKVPISIFQDNTYEGDEAFKLKLSEPVNAPIEDGEGVATIRDDERLPILRVTNGSLPENYADLEDMVFDFHLSHPSQHPISAWIKTQDFTATAGLDYVALLPQQITFAPGDVYENVAIDVLPDNVYEGGWTGGEQFLLHVYDAVNARIATRQGLGHISESATVMAVGNIDDDNSAPYVSVAPAQAEESEGKITFTVTVDDPTEVPVLVGYSLYWADTATVGKDFDNFGGWVVIPAGQPSGTFAVSIAADGIDEDNETFEVAISAINAQVSNGFATGTIIDSDGSPAISIGDATGYEGGAARFSVSLSAKSERSVSVDYATAEDTADGSDYTGDSATLWFDPGQTSKTISIPLADDFVSDSGETFFVNLSNPSNATLGTNSQATGTILETSLPFVSFDSEVEYGTEGGTITFWVSAVGEITSQVTVDYATSDGTATSVDDKDFTAASGTLTLTELEPSQSIDVTISLDALYEGGETEENFFITLSNPTNAVIDLGKSEGKISDTDSPPSASVQNVSVTEGGTAQLSITLSEAAGTEIIVNYQTAGGTAKEEEDFATTYGSVTFAAGETEKTIDVETELDELDEPDETFTFSISSDVADTTSQGTATVTIQDDDDPPSVSVEDLEVDESVSTAKFPVRLSAPSGRSVQVSLATSPIVATSPADYSSTNGTLTFEPGKTLKYFDVSIVSDSLYEWDETFRVSIDTQTISNATAGSQTEATGTILDDDSAPVIEFSDESDDENIDDFANFTVTLTAAAGFTVNVTFATEGDTATSGSDFVAEVDTVTIQPGNLTAPFDIDLIDDTAGEPDERYFVNISHPDPSPPPTQPNLVIAKSQGIGTITDSEDLPTLSIADASASEGEDAVFVVTLSEAAAAPVTVEYYTTAGTATAHADYKQTVGQLEIAVGATSGQIRVPLKEDELDEDDETFTVTLQSAENATIGTATATGTIIDDAADGPPSLTIEDAVVNEHAGNATVTVKLSAASGQDVTFSYATADGDAVSSDTQPGSGDYDSRTGEQTISAGEAEVTFTVPIVNDTDPEPIENFSVTISSPVNATIAGGTGTVTIVDNDAPTVTIDDAEVVEGGQLVFTATLSTQADVDMSFDVTVAPGTAEAADYTEPDPNPFTVTIAAGQTTAQFSITTKTDEIDEDDETINLTFSNESQNLTLGNSSATGTIKDNDDAPCLTVPNVTVTEGGTAAFVLTLSAASEREIKIYYKTRDVEAVDPDDYTGTTNHVIFAPTTYDEQGQKVPGETEKTIDIDTIDDDLYEADEDFELYLYVQDEQGSQTSYEEDPWVTFCTGSPGEEKTYNTSAYATIIDNEPDPPVPLRIPVEIFATNIYARETESGETPDVGQFVVTRGEGNTSGSLTVYYKLLTDGDSDADSGDYSESIATLDGNGNYTGSVTIADGESSATITVSPVDDSAGEWDETVALAITGVSDEQKYGVGQNTSAEITIIDNDGVAGLLNRNVDGGSTGQSKERITQGPVSVDVHQGQVELAAAIRPGSLAPSYRGDDNLHPVISLEWMVPGSEVPDSLNGSLSFGGIEGGLVTFDTSGVQSLSDSLRLVLLGDDSIASELATGHYPYEVTLTAGVNGKTYSRTVIGGTEIVNLVDDTHGTTELGERWWIEALDRLALGDGTESQLVAKGLGAESGAALIRGDNSSAWFVSSIDSHDVESTPDTQGSGWADGTEEGGHSDNYKITETSTDEATWEFTGLTANQPYQVFVTWVAGPSRESEATYEVTAGTPIAGAPTSVEVDQRYSPGEDVVESAPWRSLGYFLADSGGNITVTLSGTGGGELVADAAMVASAWTFTTPKGTYGTLSYQSGEYTLTDKYAGRYEFDSRGLLTARHDKNDNQTKFEYTDADSDGVSDEISKITVQGGLETEYTYASAYLDYVTDFAGRQTQYTISSGNVTSITEPDPNVSWGSAPQWQFAYGGPDGQLSQITDPESNVTVVGYDSDNFRVNQVTNADGEIWKLKPLLADGLGTGASGTIRKAPTGDLSDSGSSFIEARAQHTDPRGVAAGDAYHWLYQTDAYGLITALQNPLGDVWKWTRDDFGLAAQHVQPAGGGGDTPLGELTTQYQYDSQGNLTDVTYADATTEEWEYDATFSVVTSYTDQLDRETTYALDAKGNLETRTEKDPGGTDRVTKLAYTSAPASLTSLAGGLVTDVTVAFGSGDAVTDKTEYFTSGAKINLAKKVTFADGTSVQADVEYDYDANRNRNSVKDELDRETTYVYDNLDRPVNVTQPDPGTGDHTAPVTSYEYDENSNHTAIINARQKRTDYEYDAMNRLVKTKLPAAEGSSETAQGRAETVNSYDESGNLESVKDALGNFTFYAYDVRNLQTSVTQPAPNPPSGVAPPEAPHGPPITFFAYDALGNLKEVRDPLQNTTAYRYDQLSRQNRVTEPATADHGQVVTTSVLDAGGRLKEVHRPGASGGTAITFYEYDRFDRQTKITLPQDANGQTPTTTYQYDLRDNLTFVVDASGVSEFEYDARDRRTFAEQPDPDGPGGAGSRQTFTEYTAAGEAWRITAMEDGAPATARVTTMQFDNLGRVINTASTDPDGEGPAVASAATRHYDEAGNVEQVVRVVAAGQTQVTDIEYDALNRSWRTEGPIVGGVRPETVSVFDVAGRQIRLYEKTAENGGTTVWRQTDYLYDDLHRLHQWTDPEPQPGGARPTTTFFYDAAGNERFVVDALGNVTENQYDTHHRPKATILPATQQHAAPVMTTTYNAAGHVAAQTDELGRTTTFETSDLGQVMQVTLVDGGGQGLLPGQSPVINVGYDNAGNVSWLTDLEGNTTWFVNDALGRRTQTIQPIASGAAPIDQTVDDGDFSYSATGTWTYVSDAAAYGSDYAVADNDPTAVAEWKFTVTEGKTYRVLASWLPSGENSDAAPFTVFDGAASEGTVYANQQLGSAGELLGGHQWKTLGVYTITATGSDNLTVQLAGVSGAKVAADAVRVIEVGAVTRTVYDGLGQVVQTVDEQGRVTLYGYDALGRQTSVIQAGDGGFYQQAFDDDAATFSSSGSGWQTASGSGGYGDDFRYYQADGTGTHKATWTVSGLDTTKQYAVLATWSPDASNADDAVFRFFDDTTQIDSDVTVDQTALAGDAVIEGRPWQTLGRVTVTSGTLNVELDASPANGRVVADGIRLIELVPAQYTIYNAAGAVLAQSNALSETTVYGYDELFRTTSVTDPNGDTTYIQYDLQGRQTRVTDPVGNYTDFTYDNLGRVIGESITLGGQVYSESYQYNVLGSLVRVVDRSGRVADYSYDALQRPVQERWYNSVTEASGDLNRQNTIASVYDVAGRLTGVSDYFSSYAYSYDVLDRVTSVSAGHIAGGSVVLANSYSRLDGLRDSVSASIAGTADFLTSYSYDDLNRVTGIQQTGQSGGNSVADKLVDLSYNPDGRFDSILRYEDLTATDLVASSSYGYDARGRLVSLVHAQGAIPLADYAWTYDAAGRIDTFDSSADGLADYDYDARGQVVSADYDYQTDESFSFDNNGNRTNTGYQTSEHNRIATDGSRTFEYDSRGNRTKETDIATGEYTEYTWDNRNRLMAAVRKSAGGAVQTTVTFRYDLYDRLIRKAVDADGNGTMDSAERYVYDGPNVVLVFDDTGSLQTRFLHGPRIDQILAADDASTDNVSWMLADNLGTARDVADFDSGTSMTSVVNHLTYDAFGNITSQSAPSLAPRYAFTGRVWVGELGLYYYRARWYDPALGQFLSEDSIGFTAGDANTRRYVSNDPLNAIDPWGTDEISIRIELDAEAEYGLRFDVYWSDTRSLLGGGFSPFWMENGKPTKIGALILSDSDDDNLYVDFGNDRIAAFEGVVEYAHGVYFTADWEDFKKTRTIHRDANVRNASSPFGAIAQSRRQLAQVAGDAGEHQLAQQAGADSRMVWSASTQTAGWVEFLMWYYATAPFDLAHARSLQMAAGIRNVPSEMALARLGAAMSKADEVRFLNSAGNVVRFSCFPEGTRIIAADGTVRRYNEPEESKPGRPTFTFTLSAAIATVAIAGHGCMHFLATSPTLCEKKRQQRANAKVPNIRDAR